MIAGLFPVTILGELVSIGTLLAFTTVCIGVLVLRYTRPDLQAPVPRARAVVRLHRRRADLLGHDGLAAARHLAAAAASGPRIGLLIYVFYGFRNSALRRTGR